MTSLKFCQKFLKENNLSLGDARRLYDSVQKLLKKKDHPTKFEIKNAVSSILSNKNAKLFANKIFDEINFDSYQSDYDYDYYYDEDNFRKSKKGEKNTKDKRGKSKQDQNNDDDYDDNEIYYSYSESSYTEDIYSYSDVPDKPQKGKPGFNRKNSWQPKMERDKKNKGANQSKTRTSTDHITTTKTMFSRAYTSSEYQRLSKDIAKNKVPLSHRPYEKNIKNDKKPVFGNKKNDDELPNPDNESNEKDSQSNPNSNESRQRFIIYVAGLSAQVNTVSKLYRQFHSFGRILGIQVNRQELYALIEFNDLKSAYSAVNSKKPVFGNKLIKLGFASSVDSEMIEMFRKKEEEIEKQSKEMKSDLIFIDEDNQSDFSYDQSDDESYDMPDV